MYTIGHKANAIMPVNTTDPMAAKVYLKRSDLEGSLYNLLSNFK